MKKIHMIAALAAIFMFAAPAVLAAPNTAAADISADGIVDGIVDGVTDFADGIVDMFTDAVDAVVDLFERIVDGITGLNFSTDVFDEISNTASFDDFNVELTTTTIIVLCMIVAVMIAAIAYYRS